MTPGSACVAPIPLDGAVALRCGVPMICAVLSIGTELTRGELVNSNATWLGAELTSVGFEVVEHAVVDDNRERIASALRRLSQEVRIIVSTGRLGPSTDAGPTGAL